jgi:hypothetical protein
MDERKTLRRCAERARARLATVRGVEGALRTAFYASLVALAAVAAHRLFGMPLPLASLAIGLAAAVLTVGLVTALLPRITLFEAAAAVDARAGWKERLSSALAIDTATRPMEFALLEDVIERAKSLIPSSLFPLRIPREFKYAGIAILAAAVAHLFVPPLDLFGVEAKKKGEAEERQRIESVVEKLERKKAELLADEKVPQRVKDVLAKIDGLTRELQKTPPPDKKETLAKLGKLADELKKMKDELAKSESLAQQLQKAAQKDSAGELGKLGEMLKQGRFQEAAQELAKMKQALKEGSMSDADKEKLRKQLEKLAKKLEALEKSGDKDSKEFKDNLAKAMKGLEKGDEAMMDGLQQSLESLDGQMDESEALGQALKDLDDLAEALAKDQGRCPSCGKNREGGGG